MTLAIAVTALVVALLGLVFTWVLVIRAVRNVAREVNDKVIVPMNDNSVRWSQLYREHDTRITKLESNNVTEFSQWKT